jgi:predicted PurR-regulated permease PerM
MNGSTTDETPPIRIILEPGNVWRIGFVLVGVGLVVWLTFFVISGGSSFLFTLVMAWFASLAMEPAVGRLAKRMPRGGATAVVMGSVALFLAIFLALFGQLLFQQVAALVRSVPMFVTGALAWVNETFGQNYELADLLAQVQVSPEQVARYASQIAGGLLAVVGSVVGAVASSLVFLLFTYYLSAEGPRLRRWIAGLFPPRMQELTVNVWDTTAEKVGGYVGARVILATVNATLSGIVFAVIGLPSWLALAIWTGLVAQFVPAIGTYISISLPVLVGLLSPNPWLGVIVLVWGILYQQVENLTIEPRISARAVNVHPAFSFASVLLGSALFGVAGALLAIPVAAMLLTLLELYRTRYDLVPSVAGNPEAADAGADSAPSADPAAAPADPRE